MTQIIALEDNSLIELLELLILTNTSLYDCNTDTYYRVLKLFNNQVTITATRSFTTKSIIKLMDLVRSRSNLSCINSNTIFILNDYSVISTQTCNTLLNL